MLVKELSSFFVQSNGNVTKTTDAGGSVTEFVYDKLNNPVEIIVTRSELGGVKVFAYDANGNLISESDGDGYTTAREYDKNNNPSFHETM